MLRERRAAARAVDADVRLDDPELDHRLVHRAANIEEREELAQMTRAAGAAAERRGAGGGEARASREAEDARGVAALERAARSADAAPRRSGARRGSAASGPSGRAASVSARAADRARRRRCRLRTARPSGPGSPSRKVRSSKLSRRLRRRQTSSAAGESRVEDHGAGAVLSAHRAVGELPVLGAEEQRREDAARPGERAEDERDAEARGGAR